MADPRRAARVRLLALVLADPVSVSASLLAAAPLRATRVSYLPTILAWELGPRVRSLGLKYRKIKIRVRSERRIFASLAGIAARLKVVAVWNQGRAARGWHLRHRMCPRQVGDISG
jgi:hypothetical protein